MVRHSKNNTASAAFKKAEYDKLSDVWGSKTVRVGAESMRHFDQCSICLNTSEAPTTCSQGHLYCKECILSALLEQKRDMDKLQATLARLEREHEQERLRVRQEAIERIQREFERTQSAVGSSVRRRSPSIDERSRDRNRSRSPERVSGGTSTSLSDLPDRIAAQTQRAIDEAMSRLEQEHALTKRSKIPAYWLPSLTPSSTQSKEDVVRQAELALEKKLQTKCFVGDKQGHETGIKSLIDVHFTTEDEARRKICPSCRKTLNNVGKLFVLRKCGHVHCSTCVDTLLRPEISTSQRALCLECSAKAKEKDIIALQREGTGFASAGNNEAKGKGVAFQG